MADEHETFEKLSFLKKLTDESCVKRKFTKYERSLKSRSVVKTRLRLRCASVKHCVRNLRFWRTRVTQLCEKEVYAPSDTLLQSFLFVQRLLRLRCSTIKHCTPFFLLQGAERPETYFCTVLDTFRRCSKRFLRFQFLNRGPKNFFCRFHRFFAKKLIFCCYFFQNGTNSETKKIDVSEMFRCIDLWNQICNWASSHRVVPEKRFWAIILPWDWTGT